MSEIITDMKSAFDIFWNKLNAYYDKNYNCKPTVYYTKKLNPELFLQVYNKIEARFIPCEKDVNGYIQWQPMPQGEPVDFNVIENHVGFALKEELRSYYSTYLFLELRGGIGRNYFHYQPINRVSDIANIVFFQHEKAQTPFPESETFCLGHAVLEGNDSFGIYYNNAEGKVFCHDYDSNSVVVFHDSLAETIAEMEAVG